MLAAAALVVSSCGSDAPSKSEWTDKVKDSMGSDMSKQLDSLGLKAKSTEKIVDAFIGCMYDQIKDDEELLNQTFDNSATESMRATVENHAAKCNVEMSKAAAQEAGG